MWLFLLSLLAVKGGSAYSKWKLRQKQAGWPRTGPRPGRRLTKIDGYYTLETGYPENYPPLKQQFGRVRTSQKIRPYLPLVDKRTPMEKAMAEAKQRKWLRRMGHERYYSIMLE